jgi:hypothetical protein
MVMVRRTHSGCAGVGAYGMDILEPVVLFYISLTLVEAAPHRLETTLMHGRIYVA